MARISLKSVINDQFINRFAGLAKGVSDPSQALRSALSGSASTTNFSSALRTGASIYASAVQGFNAGLSFLNFARGTLTKLGGIAEELITTLEEATKIGTGMQNIRRFQRKFEALGKEFEDLIEEADIGDRQYLSKEGLAELFVTLGVDPDKSRDIAAIFDRFFLADSEDTFKGEDFFSLASEKVQAPRPVKIPPGAYGITEASTVYSLSAPVASTNTAPTTAVLTDVSTVQQLTDPEGSGFQSIQQSSTGPVLSGLTPGLSSDVTLRAVNEATGYSVIESSEDFLGQNGVGYNQLFLVDELGNVVHQLTNETLFNSTFYDADISADDLTVAFSYFNGADYRVDTVAIASANDYGVAPSGTLTNIELNAGTTVYEMVKISDNGQYVASVDDTGAVAFRNGITLDTGFSTSLTGVSSIAFASDNTLLFTQPSTTYYDLKSGTFGGGGTTTYISNDVSSLAIATLQFSNTGITVYESASTGNIMTVGSGSPTTIASPTSATQLSIAYNSVSGIDFGVVGTFGTADSELMRYNYGGSGTSELIVDKSGASITGAMISTVNNVFIDIDNSEHLNYNGSNLSLLTLSTNAITTNLAYDLTADVTLMDVDDTYGFSLIKTSQDLMGNGVVGEALFVIDAAGRAIEQFNPATAGVTILEATLRAGAGNASVSAIYDNAGTATLDVGTAISGSLGGAPTTMSTSLSSIGSTYSNLKTSDDAVFNIFEDSGVVTVEAFGVSNTLSSEYVGAYDFFGLDRVAIAKTSGSTQDIVEINAGDFVLGSLVEETLIYGLNNVTEIKARERDGLGTTDAFLAVHEGGLSRVNTYILDVTGGFGFTPSVVTESGSYSYNGADDSVTKLSVRRPTADTYTLGMFAELSTVSGDTDNELYQLNVNSQSIPGGQRFSNILRSFETIFDSARDLRRRPESYVLLADVKELAKQIEENIEVIDDLTSILNKTLETVRITGLAMLDLSDQISSSDDAYKVAKELRDRIQSEGGAAISAHSDKLYDVAAAALSLNQDSFGELS